MPFDAVSYKAFLRRPRPQIVATRGRMYVSAVGGAYTRCEGYCNHRIGPKSVNSIRLAFSNRLLGSTSETPNANDYTLEAAVLFNGVNYPVTFGGAKSPALMAGVGIILSDPLGLTLDADDVVQVRCSGLVSSGQNVPVGTLGSQRGGYQSTAVVSQVYSTGSMSLPAGGNGITTSFGTLGIIGDVGADDRHPAVAIWGDSIPSAAGDSSTADATYGHMGYVERGLIAAAEGGYNTPFTNLSRGSSVSSTATRSGNTAARWAMLEYCTHVLFGLNNNDPAGAVSLATLQANNLYAWRRAKRMGLKVAQANMWPRTTSTSGDWTSAADQTIVSGYGVAETRGLYNSWLLTQLAAREIDYIIDVASVSEDPAAPGKWVSTGAADYATADGIHPTPTLHTAAAVLVKAWAQSLTA